MSVVDIRSGSRLWFGGLRWRFLLLCSFRRRSAERTKTSEGQVKNEESSNLPSAGNRTATSFKSLAIVVQLVSMAQAIVEATRTASDRDELKSESMPESDKRGEKKLVLPLSSCTPSPNTG